MNARKLTDRQVLLAIQLYQRQHSVSPSYRELASLLGSSLTTTFRAVLRLRKAGTVQAEPSRVRSIRVK